MLGERGQRSRLFLVGIRAKQSPRVGIFYCVGHVNAVASQQTTG